MPATQKETVGLDLTGDFKTKAQEDAAAALTAAAALDRLGSSASAVKGPPKSAAEAVDDLATRMKAAKDAAENLRAQADKAFAVGNKRRGEALEKAAEELDPIFKEQKEHASLVGKALDAGGSKAKAWIVGGAAAAAAVLTAASVAAVKSVVELGVKESDARAQQTAILDQMTGGAGKIAYQVGFSLAMEKGLNLDTSIQRVKGLINARFGKEDTELLIRASADLGAIKGDEKAKGLLEKLEKVGVKGKANDESLNDLAEAGVEAAAVLEQLRRKGESLDAVRGRLKAGQIGVSEFAKAVGNSIEKSFGGITEPGLGTSINRVELQFKQLFDSFDLSPLDAALNTIQKTFDSPVGASLKDAITELGNAALDTLTVFKTSSGKQALEDFFTNTAEAARTVASVIREVKAEIQTLVNWYEGDGIVSTILGKVSSSIMMAGVTLPKSEEERIVEAQVAEQQRKRAVAEAEAAGQDIAKGYANGVLGGSQHIASAVETALTVGIEAGNKTLDRHSPSRVYGDMGKDSDLGYAKGVTDNADVVADATEGMARQGITGAMRGGGPTAGAAAQSATGSPVGGVVLNMPQVIVQVQAAPGMTAEEAKSIGDAAGEGFTSRVRAIVREMQRDAREFGAVGALA